MARWWLLILGFGCWSLIGLVLAADSAGSGPEAGQAVPVRIVSLAPNLTEILFALDAGDRVVAVTSHCNWPAGAKDRARVGTFWQPNLESIVRVRPDLVVALSMAQQKVVTRRLELMGVRCLTLQIDTLEQLMQAMACMSRELGCPDKAAALQDALTRRLNKVGQASAARPSVLWVVQRRPLRVAGQQTFINELIQRAGGRNAMGPTFYPYPPIGAEQVAACQPDVIIEPVALQDNQGARRAQSTEFWRRMPPVPATVNGRIYQVDADIVSRLGPRIAEAVEQMALCIQADAGREPGAAR